MDQTASQDQDILWYKRKRGENSNLDRRLRLCPREHREKNTETGPESLHNSTGSERHPFEEMPILQALSNIDYKEQEVQVSNQLNLSD